MQPIWDIFDFAWGSADGGDDAAESDRRTAIIGQLAIEDGTVDDGTVDDDDDTSLGGAVAADAYDGGELGGDGSGDDASVATTLPEQTPENMAPAEPHPRSISTLPPNTTWEEHRATVDVWC